MSGAIPDPVELWLHDENDGLDYFRGIYDRRGAALRVLNSGAHLFVLEPGDHPLHPAPGQIKENVA